MELSIVDLPERSALIAEATCKHSELGQKIGELFELITSTNPEAEMVDAHCVIYRAWLPEECDIEAVLPVRADTVPQGGIKLRVYPAERAVMGTHVGHYRGLADAWREYWEEVSRCGFEVSGSPWDRYVTDPGDEPDPAGWVTELYVPVRVQKF